MKFDVIEFIVMQNCLDMYITLNVAGSCFCFRTSLKRVIHFNSKINDSPPKNISKLAHKNPHSMDQWRHGLFFFLRKISNFSAKIYSNLFASFSYYGNKFSRTFSCFFSFFSSNKFLSSNYFFAIHTNQRTTIKRNAFFLHFILWQWINEIAEIVRQ